MTVSEAIKRAVIPTLGRFVEPDLIEETMFYRDPLGGAEDWEILVGVRLEIVGFIANEIFQQLRDAG